MANASGLWAWRVLALAWQVLLPPWQVLLPPWQMLCIWQERWQELVGRPRGHAMRDFSNLSESQVEQNKWGQNL